MKVKPDHDVSSSRALVRVDRHENDERPRADARFGRFAGLAAELTYMPSRSGVRLAKELLRHWLPIAQRADLANRLGMAGLSAAIMRRGQS